MGSLLGEDLLLLLEDEGEEDSLALMDIVEL